MEDLTSAGKTEYLLGPNSLGRWGEALCCSLLPTNKNMNTDCFPDWLKRRSAQVYGPQIPDPVAYPIYTVQPALVDANNPNTITPNLTDSALHSGFAGTITGATVGTRIVHIMPRNLYDLINIVAFDDGKTASVPIFLSFDRPGRIVSETPQGGSTEVNICTANAFSLTDISSFPTFLEIGKAGSNFYTCLQFSAPRTNTPFYVWFGDGIQTPPTNAQFKMTWVTVGR